MNGTLPKLVVALAALCLAALLWLALSPEPAPAPAATPARPSPPAQTATPVAPTPLPELSASGSLAYACYPALCLINADGSQFQRIAPSEEYAAYEHPAWSPDGSRLVVYASPAIIYDSFDPEAGAVVDEQSIPRAAFYQRLLLFLADGEQLKQTTLISTSGGIARAPLWSPDGSVVACELILFEGGPEAVTTRYELQLFDGRTLVPLGPPIAGGTGDRPLAWSPDGRWLLFFRAASPDHDDQSSAIWAYDYTRDALIEVAHARHAIWYPDSLALLLVDEQGRRLLRYDLDAQRMDTLLDEVRLEAKIRRETTFDPEAPLLIAQPRWSPDGTLLAFYAVPDIIYAGGDLLGFLFTIAPDALDDLALRYRPDTLVSARRMPYMGWAPSGHQLIFPAIRQPASPVPAGDEIYCQAFLMLSDLDTGEERMLGCLDGSLDSASLERSWSPDGRWLALTRWMSGDSNGSNLTNLLELLLVSTSGARHSVQLPLDPIPYFIPHSQFLWQPAG